MMPFKDPADQKQISIVFVFFTIMVVTPFIIAADTDLRRPAQSFKTSPF